VIDIKMLIEEEAMKDKEFRDIIEKYSKISEIRSRNQVFGASVVMEQATFILIIYINRQNH